MVHRPADNLFGSDPGIDVHSASGSVAKTRRVVHSVAFCESTLKPATSQVMEERIQ